MTDCNISMFILYTLSREKSLQLNSVFQTDRFSNSFHSHTLREINYTDPTSPETDHYTTL